MKRIHHPYWLWEDWKAGMWRHLAAQERPSALHAAVNFTGDALLYGGFMARVANEWPIACEHNLTERGMNRRAWIGHAAACLAIGSPEDVTRQAWGLLTEQQRIDADSQADAAIKGWESTYARQNQQLSLELAAQGLS